MTAAFQDFVRFELVLQESVGVGLLERGRGAATRSSRRSRAPTASALEQRLPDGLQHARRDAASPAGGSCRAASGSALALARGLMRPDPLLVVLDEPTASLDAASEAALFDRYAAAARRLGEAQGTITLLVSHRFSTARAADLIVVLDGGQVVETRCACRADGRRGDLRGAVHAAGAAPTRDVDYRR